MISSVCNAIISTHKIISFSMSSGCILLPTLSDWYMHETSEPSNQRRFMNICPNVWAVVELARLVIITRLYGFMLDLYLGTAWM